MNKRSRWQYQKKDNAGAYQARKYWDRHTRTYAWSVAIQDRPAEALDLTTATLTPCYIWRTVHRALCEADAKRIARLLNSYNMGAK